MELRKVRKITMEKWTFSGLEVVMEPRRPGYNQSLEMKREKWKARYGGLDTTRWRENHKKRIKDEERRLKAEEKEAKKREKDLEEEEV